MIEIFYTYFDRPLPKHLYDHYLKQLPEKDQIKNSFFQRWQDQHARLFARLLLIKVLNQNSVDCDLESIKVNDFGKPYLHKCHFNISHSGDYVVVAFSEKINLGIDIELIQQIEINDFKNIFKSDEFDVIINSDNSLKKFYTLWTQKESLIKADGRGLSMPLINVMINFNKGFIENKEWYLKEVKINAGYECWLATEHEVDSVNLNYVDFYST